MGKPQNRAALLQFGIAMMQPLGLGETGLSHAANAIGEGAEASGRVSTNDLKQQQQQSQEDLRQAQAGLAESRAGAAERSADSALQRRQLGEENLELRKQNLQSTKLNSLFRAQSQSNAAYQKAADEQELMTGKRPTYGDWLTANPHMDPRSVYSGAEYGSPESSAIQEQLAPAQAQAQSAQQLKSFNDVWSDPKLVTQQDVIAAREAAKSNDPAVRARVKAAADGLAARVNPRERGRVYKELGLAQ
jgi:hypothetical protein